MIQVYCSKISRIGMVVNTGSSSNEEDVVMKHMMNMMKELKQFEINEITATFRMKVDEKYQYILGVDVTL